MAKIVKDLGRHQYDDAVYQELKPIVDLAEKSEKVSNDYVKDLDVTIYVVRICMAAKSGDNVLLPAKQPIENYQFNRLRQMAEEMEYQRIIGDVVHGLGSGPAFTLIQKDAFEKYTARKLRLKIDAIKPIKPESALGRIVVSIKTNTATITREVVISATVSLVVFVILRFLLH